MLLRGVLLCSPEKQMIFLFVPMFAVVLRGKVGRAFFSVIGVIAIADGAMTAT